MKFLDSFPLWHRLRGHKVHRGFNILNPITTGVLLRYLRPEVGDLLMTTHNLEQIIAKHRPDEPGCTGCSWHVHPLACDYDDFATVHAAHVVAAIRDSGLTVIALPEATYGDGTRIAFEYDEPRRADISCTRCLREIEAYGQLVHRGLVAGHAWRHVDDKSTTCLGLYPTGNCRPHDDYDADRKLAAQVAERNNP